MTTVVVVRKKNEIAIAADSQSTFGDTRLAASMDARWDKIFLNRMAVIFFDFGQCSA